MGICRPGDMGFDVMHSTCTRRSRRPTAAAVPVRARSGVKKHLAPFLPVPTVEFDGQKYYLDYDRPQSIGQMKAFYGNFLVVVKAYAYIRSLGPDGLKAASEDAVLNANYILRRITEYYDLPYDRHYKHEFVVSPQRIKKETGVHTMDISKRLLDYGVHPPTNYFPLIVDEAIMIEPTETESKDPWTSSPTLLSRSPRRPIAILRASMTHRRHGGWKAGRSRSRQEPRLRWRKNA
jgi:glycine dehydrogenase subunit 2